MILGLDISTSITGATVIDSDGSCLYNEYWDTRSKKRFPSLFHKASYVKERLIDISYEYMITSVFIEQSLQSFRSGFSSAKTLSTLASFNGIVSYLCWNIYSMEPQMLAASSARKSIGIQIKKGENSKQKSFDFVVANEPTFVVEYTRHGNPKPGTLDKSDSWVIAKAGHLICTAKN
jgi:hypothetical protein